LQREKIYILRGFDTDMSDSRFSFGYIQVHRGTAEHRIAPLCISVWNFCRESFIVKGRIAGEEDIYNISHR
jgi:hypothetical protein